MQQPLLKPAKSKPATLLSSPGGDSSPPFVPPQKQNIYNNQVVVSSFQSRQVVNSKQQLGGGGSVPQQQQMSSGESMKMFSQSNTLVNQQDIYQNAKNAINKNGSNSLIDSNHYGANQSGTNNNNKSLANSQQRETTSSKQQYPQKQSSPLPTVASGGGGVNEAISSPPRVPKVAQQQQQYTFSNGMQATVVSRAAGQKLNNRQNSGQYYGNQAQVSNNTQQQSINSSIQDAISQNNKNVSRKMRDQANTTGGQNSPGKNSAMRVSQNSQLWVGSNNQNYLNYLQNQKQSVTTLNTKRGSKKPLDAGQSHQTSINNVSQVQSRTSKINNSQVGLVDVYWKIHKERRKRERDIEYKPGQAKATPILSSEQRHAIVQEVLTNKKGGIPDQSMISGLSIQHHAVSVQKSIPQNITSQMRSSILQQDGSSNEYFGNNTTNNKNHRRQYSENMNALEQQRKDANNFWNGSDRFKILKRSEWEIMDFYDQKHLEKIQDTESDGGDKVSRQRQNNRNEDKKSTGHGALSFMTITPSPEKQRNVPTKNEAFVSSFDSLSKRNEIVLKEAATIRRNKKQKLNSLYFQSQVKSLIFCDYQDSKDQQQSQQAPATFSQSVEKANNLGFGQRSRSMQKDGQVGRNNLGSMVFKINLATKDNNNLDDSQSQNNDDQKSSVNRSRQQINVSRSPPQKLSFHELLPSQKNTGGNNNVKSNQTVQFRSLTHWGTPAERRIDL